MRLSTTPSRVTRARASMVTVPGSSMPFFCAMETRDPTKAPMSRSDRLAVPKSATMASRSESRCAWSTSALSDMEKRMRPSARRAESFSATATIMSERALRSREESLPIMPRSM